MVRPGAAHERSVDIEEDEADAGRVDGRDELHPTRRLLHYDLVEVNPVVLAERVQRAERCELTIHVRTHRPTRAHLLLQLLRRPTTGLVSEDHLTTRDHTLRDLHTARLLSCHFPFSSFPR